MTPIPNTIIQADCHAIITQWPNDCIDHVITSPPYNTGYNKMLTQHGIPPKVENRYIQHNDNMNTDEYTQWLTQIINQLLRITRQYIFLNIQLLSNNKKSIIQIIHTYQNHIKDIIIWNKTQAPPQINPGIMNTNFEFIIILTKKDPEDRQFKNAQWRHGTLSNVITGTNTSTTNTTTHAATYPEYLPTHIIRNFTKPEELILDPFIGSGTTALACIKNQRNYIGIEISPEYAQMTEKRIREWKTQTRIPTTLNE